MFIAERRGIEPRHKNHALPCVFPHRHPSLNAFRVVTLGLLLSLNLFTFFNNPKKYSEFLTYLLVHFQFQRMRQI